MDSKKLIDLFAGVFSLEVFQVVDNSFLGVDKRPFNDLSIDSLIQALEKQRDVFKVFPDIVQPQTLFSKETREEINAHVKFTKLLYKRPDIRGNTRAGFENLCFETANYMQQALNLLSLDNSLESEFSEKDLHRLTQIQRIMFNLYEYPTVQQNAGKQKNNSKRVSKEIYRYNDANILAKALTLAPLSKGPIAVLTSDRSFIGMHKEIYCNGSFIAEGGGSYLPANPVEIIYRRDKRLTLHLTKPYRTNNKRLDELEDRYSPRVKSDAPVPISASVSA